MFLQNVSWWPSHWHSSCASLRKAAARPDHGTHGHPPSCPPCYQSWWRRSIVDMWWSWWCRNCWHTCLHGTTSPVTRPPSLSDTEAWRLLDMLEARPAIYTLGNRAQWGCEAGVIWEYHHVPITLHWQRQPEVTSTYFQAHGSGITLSLSKSKVKFN